MVVYGCSQTHLPEEMGIAENMDHELWKAQAPLYTPEDYRAYQKRLREIKDDLIKEEARIAWFRDYKDIEGRLKVIVEDGKEILKKAEGRKEATRIEITTHLTKLREEIARLDRLTHAINEGRLARKNLTKGELMAEEAGLFLERGDYDQAAERLTGASNYINAAEDSLTPIFNRYVNKYLLKKWKRWAEDTVAETKRNGGTAIVVTKIDKSLAIYKDGKLIRTYEIGLGRNGFRNKLHSGDGATPEGRYRVVKKLPRSQFHKALLLDYPNNEDMRAFIRAKRSGVISRKAAIGDLIEIHGGGKDGMTLGCVSLEDRDMDEVFEVISFGTPVTIVGATDLKNDILTGPKRAEG